MNAEKKKTTNYIMETKIERNGILGTKNIMDKDLKIINPMVQYGRRRIRKLMSIRGGKNENKNVISTARKRGYTGDNINTAYVYLSNIINKKILNILKKQLIEEEKKSKLGFELTQGKDDTSITEEYKFIIQLPPHTKVTHTDENDNTIKTYYTDDNEYGNSKNDVYWFLLINSNETIFENTDEEYNGHKLYILYGEKPQKTTSINQSFKEGSYNCLLQPIKSFVEEKINNSNTNGTKLKYISKLNKLNKLNDKYYDTGINEDKVTEIANELQIDIYIALPFQNDYIQAKSQKKPLKTFKYTNNKLNHVELDFLHYDNNIVILKSHLLNKKYEELKNKNIYFTYTRNKTKISSIKTIDTIYKLDNDYQETIYNFELDNNLFECKLCNIKNKDVSTFIRQGTHFNETIDNINNDYGSHLKHGIDYYNIDMKRAYSNYKKCEYYNGFLGKVTDFRKCNKMEAIGFYRITNINFNNNSKLKKYNDWLKIWNNYNVYPSCELEYLTDKNVTFDILEGCWGSRIDFEFNDELLNKKTEDGVRYYCKYVGCMYSNNKYNSFYINTDNDITQHIINEVNSDNILKYNDELRVMYNKNNDYHLCHIAGFITSYMRLNMMEQLEEFEIDDIYRIATDGIYFKCKDINLKNCFRHETKDIKFNSSCDSYISNNEDTYYLKGHRLKMGEYKEHYMVSTHLGPGGCGKTHINLTDEGYVNPKYYAPSYKLSRKKQKDYNINSSVSQKLTTTDPTMINIQKNSNNVLIIDEVSMMSNEEKEYILKNYDNCKILFCGDIGFQLPCFSKDKTIKFTPFKPCGKVIEYTKNYRIKCDKLHKILKKCREMMKNKINIIDYVLQNFDIYKKENINYNYKTDMIISSTHIGKDYFTDKYKHLNKFYITKTDRVYGRGEIVFEKPETNDYVIQHAYTIHSIQGETAEGKLFIDLNRLTGNQMIYTALSRAEYYNQIILIE